MGRCDVFSDVYAVRGEDAIVFSDIAGRRCVSMPLGMFVIRAGWTRREAADAILRYSSGLVRDEPSDG